MIDEMSENRGHAWHGADFSPIARANEEKKGSYPAEPRTFGPKVCALLRKAAVGGGCRALPSGIIPFIWHRSFFLVVVFLLVSGGAAFSQNHLDPLWNYRSGRELESLNRMREADYFYGEAVRLSTEAISRNAATRDTYTALTWTLERQQKYDEVIIWGERGLRLYADEYRIVETMGEAYFYLDDHEQSLRFMQRYINSAPGGERISVAYFFIGEIYRFRKQFHHADIAYTTAVRLEPGLALWWYRLGSVREAAGDFPPAVQAYEQAVKLTPNYPEAANGLSRSRRQAGG